MAKKEKASKAVATVDDQSSSVHTNGPARVATHDVARRAYELDLARDRAHGHDLDDWLQAERDLEQRQPADPH